MRIKILALITDLGVPRYTLLKKLGFFFNCTNTMIVPPCKR